MSRFLRRELKQISSYYFRINFLKCHLHPLRELSSCKYRIKRVPAARIVKRFDKTSGVLTAVAVHAFVRRSPLFYYILISGRVRCCVGKAKAITIINLFLLPRMPPPEGHDSAMPLLYRSSPPPTIPLYFYNPPTPPPAPQPPLRPPLPRVFFCLSLPNENRSGKK